MSYSQQLRSYLVVGGSLTRERVSLEREYLLAYQYILYVLVHSKKYFYYLLRISSLYCWYVL